MIRYISENPSRLDNSIGEEMKKHLSLITGPKGNSELCFPETLNFPRDECRIPPDSKIEKKMPKKWWLCPQYMQAVKPSCPAEMTR